MTAFGRRMLGFVLGMVSFQLFFAASSINIHHGAADRALYEWQVDPNPRTEAAWLSAKAARQEVESRLRLQAIAMGFGLAALSAWVLVRRTTSPGITTLNVR